MLCIPHKLTHQPRVALEIFVDYVGIKKKPNKDVNIINDLEDEHNAISDK